MIGLNGEDIGTFLNNLVMPHAIAQNLPDAALPNQKSSNDSGKPKGDGNGKQSDQGGLMDIINKVVGAGKSSVGVGEGADAAAGGGVAGAASGIATGAGNFLHAILAMLI